MNGHLLDVLEVQPRPAPRADLQRCVQLVVQGVLLCLALAAFFALMWFCMWCAVDHRALIPYVVAALIGGPLLVALVAACLSNRRRAVR